MIDEASLRTELRHALDPVAWAIEELGVTPDDWQQRVLRTSSKRVLLNCCRQSGKSTITAIKAFHRARFDPGSTTLIYSKTARQAGLLLKKIKTYLASMKRPPVLNKDNEDEIVFRNGSEIISLPGDGTNTRGFSSPALVIEDEAAFCLDELYSAILPMLATTNGDLWLLSSPNGKRGHFHRFWSEMDPRWHREQVTGAMCPRISEEFLRQYLEDSGPNAFQQEFECKFVEADGQYFSDVLITAAFERSPSLLPLVF